ncbi:MAG TPA: ornithine cyclodeaminase family protein [Candidatus Binatia bacterium]|jgi:ornithine cyclodeaminase/alanine dehydrogenase-like protein (mu-crystallin family)|nr:ornithine cyclodeaminase family protein [Candidatus Binatia bacterium]
MTMIINNQEVEKVLTMADTIAALEKSYLQLAAGEAVCRPRIDIRIPTSDPARNYQWGTMEGGSTAGYFAIRMKSDIIYETEYNGAVTQEKYCMRPGLYCGLILLTSIENGELLAFINDGYLQHMRVGADGGIGVKYLANQDAEVVGILGSGGMARTHMAAFMHVRKIEKLQVFSPTRENRERFGREMAAKYNIEVKVCNRPEDVYKGAHILAALTDSAVEVTDGTLLEKGTHIVTVGGSGKPDPESLKRVDVYLRFGDTPAPVGHPELATDAEHVGYEARPQQNKFGDGRQSRRKHGNSLPDRRVTLADLVSGRVKGRTSPDQITYSERGNLQGTQFHAVAGKVYELAKQAGLGREIPTEWFLQDIRD